MVEPFARASREVRRSARRLEALVGRRNTPMVGAYREAFVRRIIGAHLPEGLEAGSGFVRSPSGELSRQLDVVVYEAGSAGPPFAQGGFVVADCRGVRAVIEVKSRLARGSFLQALGELSRVKGWVGPEMGQPPIYAALAAFVSAGPGALMGAAQDYYGGRLAGSVVDQVAVLGGWSLVAGWLPWPASPALGSEGGGELEIPALASLRSSPEGEDVSLHLLVVGLLVHLNDFAGHPSEGPLLESYRPLSLAFGQPAVAVLGDLSAVEPGFLMRHDRVFRQKGLRLDLPRRLILQAS
jgi:hypothetical protein